MILIKYYYNFKKFLYLFMMCYNRIGSTGIESEN